MKVVRWSCGGIHRNSQFFPEMNTQVAAPEEIKDLNNHLKGDEAKGKINDVVSMGTWHRHMAFRKMLWKDLDVQLMPGSECGGI